MSERAVALLAAWLNSETQAIRDSFVPPSEQDDPDRVDAHWNVVDPAGFELAVETRQYLRRAGWTPPEHAGDAADATEPGTHAIESGTESGDMAVTEVGMETDRAALVERLRQIPVAAPGTIDVVSFEVGYIEEGYSPMDDNGPPAALSGVAVIGPVTEETVNHWMTLPEVEYIGPAWRLRNHASRVRAPVVITQYQPFDDGGALVRFVGVGEPEEATE